MTHSVPGDYSHAANLQRFDSILCEAFMDDPEWLKEYDPVEKAQFREMAMQMRNLMLGRVMPASVVKGEVDNPRLHDSKRAIVEMMEMRNVWRAVKGCKSPEDMHGLLLRCTYRYFSLSKTLQIMMLRAESKHDDALLSRMKREVGSLEAFATDMFALGCIRGIQLGTQLNSKTEGHVDKLLKHAAIRKLLLQEPIASNLKICQALDKVEYMPTSKGWKKLNKKYGTEYGAWKAAAGETSVRNLITRARRVAIQDATFQEFLSVARGVGDAGSVTNQFRRKKYASLVKSKK